MAIKNVAHQTAAYLDDNSVLAALKEQMERLQVEEQTEFDIMKVANTSGSGSTITAGMLDAGSYRYTFIKNGINTSARTTTGVGADTKLNSYQPVLQIDERKKTDFATIDRLDVAAGYDGLEAAASTIVYNTPIVELNKKAFKLLVTEATGNWETVSNQAAFDSLDSEAFYQKIAKSITEFKMKQDEFQSNGIQKDLDLMVVMGYDGVAKLKNALTSANTGSPRQADEFYKSLSSGFTVNGVRVMITNHLPPTVKYLVTTVGKWGALSFKVAFKTAAEKMPGKIDTFRTWAEYTNGMMVLFPQYVNGFSIGAKPTK